MSYLLLALTASCGMVGTDFVCEFPVLEDQTAVSYCVRAWAMPAFGGTPTTCDGLGPQCSDPTNPFCMCLEPEHQTIPQGPPQPLSTTVNCDGPFPSDPNTPPCFFSIHEFSVDYNTHPITMFKVQPIDSIGIGSGCDVHWIPGTLDCDPPEACDFDWLP